MFQEILLESKTTEKLKSKTTDTIQMLCKEKKMYLNTSYASFERKIVGG